MSPLRHPDWFDPCDPHRAPSRVESEVRDTRLDEVSGKERRRAWVWRLLFGLAAVAVLVAAAVTGSRWGES